ncbi:hypothetical protein A3F27_00860 [Candidatus Kaiserbacteria bacterium RIFCSPHIGHO2_12_FULL_53_13]|uniref:Uncharacterized protein n=1 Tax=Candidatus Kaiserbacteria bacterium RIFCSPHIGHO2_12_FULL_53_13 TaxID=1798502 RepID=A0A1F6E7V0_9BACT|nr:MAG: hypothetical protein A3F27_00860 [Candidatus Kaiserbacteria bacterium RIFCSPHIGHO2_12_FULL_53_13]
MRKNPTRKQTRRKKDREYVSLPLVHKTFFPTEQEIISNEKRAGGPINIKAMDFSDLSID